jgi:hypothetical protein
MDLLEVNGYEDVSRLRDISVGGLFIETREPWAVGTSVRLHFLVQEGQIRADAVVRHAKPGVDLGLKFAALSEQDRPQLSSLLTRLRGTHHIPRNRATNALTEHKLKNRLA